MPDAAQHRLVSSFAIALASELNRSADELVFSTREYVYTAEELCAVLKSSIASLSEKLTKAGSELGKVKERVIFWPESESE